jgi:hypothetical protein
MSTLAVAGVFLVALTAWVGLRAVSRRFGDNTRTRAAMFLLRVVAAFACLLSAMRLSMRFVLLATNWRLWMIALGGGLAIESLLSLYSLERRTAGRGAGLAMTGLRILAVLAVVTMLAQPVFRWELVERLDRNVAVLIDTSASMNVRDTQRGGPEKLRLAEMLSPSAPRRGVRFEQVARAAGALGARLAAAAEDLAGLAGVDARARRRQLDARRKDLFDQLAAARKDADALDAAFDAALGSAVKLDDQTARDLADARAGLARGARDRLDKALAIAAPASGKQFARQYEPLLEALRGAMGALLKLSAEIEPLGRRYDQAFYDSLSDGQRRAIDAVTDRSRLELAREVLLAARPAGAGADGAESLLDKLQAGYKVRLYEFARRCAPTDASSVQAAAEAAAEVGPAPTDQDPTAEDAPDAWGSPAGEQATDLAGAIAQVSSEMSGRQLAGIVVLTDGRHNGPAAPEPLAAQLGLGKVPICPVLMAPSRPPRDAAVLAIDAPQTVVEGDKLLVRAELKLDGLAGRTVEVALMDGRRKVASQAVRVPDKAESCRPRVMLSDEPAGEALHGYVLRIARQDGEVFADNNDRPLTVNVTRRQTRLLIIDDRPRWEFRYLRNMFDGRDRGVTLQYVLLHPDNIADSPPRPAVSASAARPAGQAEAADMPASPDEWMKFDVIVLGDVPPGAMKPWQLDTLRRFVTDRGGTLVVVAGTNFMPHAYARTPLEEILPVRLAASDKPPDGGSPAGLRIAVTAEGREHPVMFQKVQPEENDAVWASLPPIYWRHPSLAAKEGATVLAYAEPLARPDFLRTPTTEESDNEPLLRQRDAQRRAFQRENPLIVLHNVAAGRVMAICFDSTWRMRYRAGDTYHHRFWGQVMRWATADKLAGGTDHVQLGADRTRYQPDQPVRVRARLVRADLSPVISQDAAVKLYRGEELVMRRRMEYQPGSAGMYEATLGTLASGNYRVELDAPEAGPILAMDNVSAVSAEFAVDAVGSAEELELSGGTALLGRLASLSGGVVLQPDQADRLIDALGPPSLTRRQWRELRVWDSWPLLGLIIAAVSAEWIIRKRAGLT